LKKQRAAIAHAFTMQITSRAFRQHRHARVASETTHFDSFLIDCGDDAYSSTKSLPATNVSKTGTDMYKSTKNQRSRGRKCGFLDARRWRFGLHAGLYASAIVLLSNISLLLAGIISRDDTFKGISTIAKGEMRRVTTMTTAYHVLINVLSTILLTSTNYAMQILCAPTRREVEKAHASGHWLDIGIMSIHNLRHIDRKRVIVWVLLALSSVPLHLL
jgi:hypothetical protein